MYFMNQINQNTIPVFRGRVLCLGEGGGKFRLFSDHNGALSKRQPRAMLIGRSPKGKGNPKPQVDWPVLSGYV